MFKNIISKAKNTSKTIILAWWEDERVLVASKKAVEENLAKIILTWDKDKIIFAWKKIWINADFFDIIDFNLEKDKFIELAFSHYNNKFSKEVLENDFQNSSNFWAFLLSAWIWDWMIWWSSETTANVIRAWIKFIWVKEKLKKISSLMILIKNEEVLFFSDIAVNIDPDAKDIAQITLDSAKTIKSLWVEPQVSLLSFSTNWSWWKHPEIEKMKEALKIIKFYDPDLVIDWESQFDSAYDENVRKMKFPNSKIIWKSNLFIFPDLNSGNIWYKIAERLWWYRAIWPILQWFSKPINDLSRWCSSDDIFYLIWFTVCQNL